MLNQISKFFSIPHKLVRTSGTQAGVILHFCNSYLKIYGTIENKYEILHYRYGETNPFATFLVPFNELKQFAAYFNDKHSDRKSIEKQLAEMPHPPHYEFL